MKRLFMMRFLLLQRNVPGFEPRRLILKGYCFIFFIAIVMSGSFAAAPIRIFTDVAVASSDSNARTDPEDTIAIYAVVNDSKDGHRYQRNGDRASEAGAGDPNFFGGGLSKHDKIVRIPDFDVEDGRIVIPNEIPVRTAKPVTNPPAASISCTTPVVTVKADYCSVAGNVLLKSTTSISGSYLWSTGETTSSILVDEVGTYSVIVTTAGGCAGVGSIKVGKEMVINGDFESGPTGFTTPPLGANQYKYQADVAGNSELVPEGLYGIGSNAQNYHSMFWGNDHTTGSGNYMIINGFPNGAPQPVVWQETVKVMPNIVYYFSAWGKSLNNVKPFAQLQFNVNGTQVGTSPVLPSGVNNNSNANWIRFYGTLTTGPTDTTAVISITDLQNATGGNDFGLDDISFGTLATFIKLESAPGTDSQTVCLNTPLINIVYSVGSTDSVPVITGLPPGLTTSFDGTYFTISGSPGVSGQFPYTITTSGTCNRTSAFGVITVNSQSINLSSGDASPSVCINTPVSIKYTLQGTSTGATASGLPSGVSMSVSGDSLLITGTPTDSGSYSYNITSSGTCAQATAAGTIKVNPTVSIPTVAQNATLCPQPFSALSTSFSVAADSGTTYQWQEDNGTGWTNLINDENYSGVTTNNITLNNIPESMDGYQYRALLTNDAACYVPESVPDSLIITNVWRGTSSCDWSTPENWWGNVVPDLDCQYVIIPNVAPQHFPVLKGSETREVRNIVIKKDASVTLTNSSTLQVRGSIYADMFDSAFGYLDARDGRIELTGGGSHAYSGTDSAQVIAGSLFKSRTVKDLRISNPLNASVENTPNDTLNIAGTLSFGPVNNTTLYTGNNITLISGPLQTASVADITNNLSNSGNNINGDIVVERYINTGTGAGQHDQAWEFLATPTTGQTVKQSWMEEGSMLSSNYGTQLTGPGGTNSGFDRYSIYPSMKFYNSDVTSQWQGISNTGIPVYNPHGYMLFVRGDRSIAGPFTQSNTTRLRTKGTLLTYDVTVPLDSNKYTSVGNPYASAIDMTKVMGQSPDVDKFFTVWNSSNYGTYGFGSYVTYSQEGSDFISTPGGITRNNIESGQAFFVKSADGKRANMLFTETCKAGDSSPDLFGAEPIPGETAQLRTNLYGINGSGRTYTVDGTFQEFRDDFNAGVDDDDAFKLFNGGENLYIIKGNTPLIIERTKTPAEQDTIQFRLTGTVKQRYRLEFISKGLSASAIQAFAGDNYLHTLTPLKMEDTTRVDFAIDNNSGSYSSNRFYIIFKSLPVTITSFTARDMDRNVQLDWKVINEKGILQYDVERSDDGLRFSKKDSIISYNNSTGNYSWLDKNILPGYYYYRVRMIDKKGRMTFSEKQKVLVGNGNPLIAVSPNPVTDGAIHLQLLNLPAGKYGIRLMNYLGQVMFSKKIERGKGSNVEIVDPGRSIPGGVYQLEVSQPDGEIKTIRVMY